MQNAYASYQVTQSIGRFSWPPESDVVHVLSEAHMARFASVGSIPVSQLAFHPVS